MWNRELEGKIDRLDIEHTGGVGDVIVPVLPGYFPLCGLIVNHL